MKPRDLLEQAEFLAKRAPRRPKQADLKRAVSAAYYAAFHALCWTCANTLVGTGAKKPERAWRQVYRAVEHGPVKERCRSIAQFGFGRDVEDFARAFVVLQEQRHVADYDPTNGFKRSEVFGLIGLSRAAVEQINKVNIADRRAFAAYVLFKAKP